MPSRNRRHMAVFKGVMIAHAPVVTDERASGGWMGWMPAKMIPATPAAKPLQRMGFGAVIFLLPSFASAAVLGPPLSTPAAIPSVLVISLVVIVRPPLSVGRLSSEAFA